MFGQCVASVKLITAREEWTGTTGEPNRDPTSLPSTFYNKYGVGGLAIWLYTELKLLKVLNLLNAPFIMPSVLCLLWGTSPFPMKMKGNFKKNTMCSWGFHMGLVWTFHRNFYKWDSIWGYGLWTVVRSRTLYLPWMTVLSLKGQRTYTPIMWGHRGAICEEWALTSPSWLGPGSFTMWPSVSWTRHFYILCYSGHDI